MRKKLNLMIGCAILVLSVAFSTSLTVTSVVPINTETIDKDNSAMQSVATTNTVSEGYASSCSGSKNSIVRKSCNACHAGAPNRSVEEILKKKEPILVMSDLPLLTCM